MEPLLQVKNIAKEFPGVKALEDISIDFCKQVFKDNPLGQSAESTPIAIVRKVG